VRAKRAYVGCLQKVSGWEAWLSQFATPVRMLVAFCAMNILLYVDRGIAAGAPEQLGAFVEASLHTRAVDKYLGLLSSAYIVGFGVASVACASLVHRYPPLKVVAGGLAIWVCSSVLTAVAPNYWVLLFARTLSGAAESTASLTIPCWIDDNAPRALRSAWLGSYFSAIPFGTALGFVFGANVATNLKAGWRAAYVIEAIIMTPLAVPLFFLPYHLATSLAAKHPPPQDHAADALSSGGAGAASINSTGRGGALDVEGDGAGEGGGVGGDAVDEVTGATPLVGDYYYRPEEVPELHVAEKDGAPISTATAVTQRLHGEGGEDGGDVGGGDVTEPLLATQAGVDGDGLVVVEPPTLWEEFTTIVKRPEYAAAVLGYASYTAVLSGLANFAPLFVLALGLMKTEPAAATTFGAIISITGLLGTVLGGMALDRMVRWVRDDSDRRLQLTTSRGAAGPSDAPADPSSTAAASAASTASTDEEEATSLRSLDVKIVAALLLCTVTMALGFVFSIVVPFATASAPLFFVFLAVGSLFLFVSTAPVNVAIMAAVPPENRPLAIGLGTILTHLFGDVPSPPIIGLLADDLAPERASGARSKHGLQLTLFLVMLWLAWGILLWGVGTLYALRRRAANERARAYVELGGNDAFPTPNWAFW
jgi:MFS transporter, Spinster family, sphingosine-1-phosphate transporter